MTASVYFKTPMCSFGDFIVVIKKTQTVDEELTWSGPGQVHHAQ